MLPPCPSRARRPGPVLAALASTLASAVLLSAPVLAEDFGHISSPLAHNDQLWPSGKINVCWEDTSPATANERRWVREAAENSWEAASDVDFQGWQQCPAANSADGNNWVRIGLRDVTPHVVAIGRALANVPNGVVLAFDFTGALASNFATCIDTPANPGAREFCIRAIAAHEFGHVLGFPHEQNRADAPAACREAEAQGEDPTHNITAYDPESIMNYCSTHWNNAGTLSATDVFGVRSLYGPFTSETPALVHYRATLDIVDGDSFRNPDERGHYEFSGTLPVVAGRPAAQDFQYCVDNEVSTLGSVSASVNPDVVSGVTGTANMVMYESDFCVTRGTLTNIRPEASGTRSVLVTNAAPSFVDVNLRNSAVIGRDDTANLHVEFSRVPFGEPGATADASGCAGCTQIAETARFADDKIIPEGSIFGGKDETAEACSNGMKPNAKGLCECPDGTTWNGRQCFGVTPVTTVTSPANTVVTVPTTVVKAYVCPADMAKVSRFKARRVERRGAKVKQLQDGSWCAGRVPTTVAPPVAPPTVIAPTTPVKCADGTMAKTPAQCPQVCPPGMTKVSHISARRLQRRGAKVAQLKDRTWCAGQVPAGPTTVAPTVAPTQVKCPGGSLARTLAQCPQACPPGMSKVSHISARRLQRQGAKVLRLKDGAWCAGRAPPPPPAPPCPAGMKDVPATQYSALAKDGWQLKFVTKTKLCGRPGHSCQKLGKLGRYPNCFVKCKNGATAKDHKLCPVTAPVCGKACQCQRSGGKWMGNTCLPKCKSPSQEFCWR